MTFDPTNLQDLIYDVKLDVVNQDNQEFHKHDHQELHKEVVQEDNFENSNSFLAALNELRDSQINNELNEAKNFDYDCSNTETNLLGEEFNNNLDSDI